MAAAASAAARAAVRTVARRAASYVAREVAKVGLKQWLKRYMMVQAIKNQIIKPLVTPSAPSTKGKAINIDKVSDEDLEEFITKELEKPANQTRIENAAERGATNYINEHMSFSWWDLVPGVGEARLVAQIYDVCSTNHVNDAAMEEAQKEVYKIMEEQDWINILQKLQNE